MTRLRIAVTVDPILPVPPKLYGGIERVVDFLVRELVRRGHDVTLFAHPFSVTPAELVPYGRPPHWGTKARLTELWQVGSELYRRGRRLDVVHSFGRLAALIPILPIRRLAKIQSYQRDGVPWRSVAVARKLAGGSIAFTGCSQSVFRGSGRRGDAHGWRAIFNGVDLDKYTPTEAVAADAPLVFLGRIEPMKGAHHAIEIARRSGRRLVIAGNRVDSPEGSSYFEQRIGPFIDGERVRYVGPVDDAAKNDVLGRAAALLMAIEWEEPFGIVMAEAFACGTPVIGFRRGSVPDVVIERVNGFVVDEVEGAVQAVGRLSTLDRRMIRKDCERRFSPRVIVDQYESLYRELTCRSSNRVLDSLSTAQGVVPVR
jgi:glycosyltransferase involved in cell wall biosynthesis